MEEVKEINSTQPTAESVSDPEIQPEEGLQNDSGDQLKEEKRQSLLKRLFYADAIICVTLPIVILITYLFNLAIMEGSNLSIIYSITLLIKLFSFRSAQAYQIILGAEISVVYFVFLGIMIKKFVVALKRIKIIKGIAFNQVDFLYKNTIDMFKIILVTKCYICLFFESGYTALDIILMLIVGLEFLYHSYVSYIYKNQSISWRDLVIEGIKGSLVFITICLLCETFKYSALKTLVDEFPLLYSGGLSGNVYNSIYLIYNSVIQPVLYTALMIVVLYYIDYQLDPNPYATSEKVISGKILGNIIFVSVIIGLQALVSVIVNTGLRNSFGDIINIIWAAIKSTYFPFLLMTIILYILNKLSVGKPNKLSADKNSNQTK